MKSYLFIPIALLAVTTFSHCKKDDPPTPVPVDFEVEYYMDNEALEMDTIRYINDAGNKFSVTRLYYYISGIVFVDDKGDRYLTQTAHYMDASDKATSVFTPRSLPEGNYVQLELKIGLTKELNVFGSLPNTVENNAMFWPEQMGGGYHFMKLEGHFMSSENQVKGFAMHIGTNPTLVDIKILHDFTISKEKHRLRLRMNLQEWFRNPTSYDLNTGNYSMGESDLMQQITNNGKDVFSLVP